MEGKESYCPEDFMSWNNTFKMSRSIGVNHFNSRGKSGIFVRLNRLNF